jgi:hypothetical protein
MTSSFRLRDAMPARRREGDPKLPQGADLA